MVCLFYAGGIDWYRFANALQGWWYIGGDRTMEIWPGQIAPMPYDAFAVLGELLNFPGEVLLVTHVHYPNNMDGERRKGS